MRNHIWAALCLCLAAAPVYADAGDIKARQQYMKDWRGLNKKMSGILKNSNAQTFPAQQFAALAAELNSTANEPWEYYGPGTNGANSEAKSAVWEKPQQFQAAIKRFNQAAAALSQAAAGGNYQAVKASFDKMAQSCKACHQAFKE